MVDASVLVRALGQDTVAGDHARLRLRRQQLVAPHLVDLEVASAWRKLHARGHMTESRAQRALAELARLPLRRVSHRRLTARCWELRDNLTPYDAAYVALAELLGVTLLTGDGAFTRAPGLRCDIEMLGDP